VFASLICARYFGEIFWDAAFGNNFGEQFWGVIMGNNFVVALTNNYFEERRFWGVALKNNFRKQI